MKAPDETIPENIVVVSNPNSTNSHKTEAVLNQLRSADSFFDIHRVDVSRDLEDMMGRINEELAKRATSLIIAGGDGTIHSVTNGLLSHGEHEIPPIFLLGTGRQNDFATLVHGNTKHLLDTVLGAQVTDLSPVLVTVDRPNEPLITENAWLYASFGAGASSAEYLNKEVVRKLPTRRIPLVGKVIDGTGVINTILQEKPFVARVGNEPTRELADYSFMLSNRMGGVIHSGKMEFGEEAKVISFDSYHRRLQIFQLLAGRVGTVRASDDIPSLEIVQAPQSGVRWAIEGEDKPTVLPSGTKVHFTRSPRSLRFYTRKK